MAERNEVQGFPFKAPLGGNNFADPLPDMDPMYSPWMWNVYAGSQGVNLRWNIQDHCTGSAGTYNFISDGVIASKVFGYCSTTKKMYDLTAAGSIPAGTDVSADFSTTDVFTSNFSNALYFFDATGYFAGKQGAFYNASTSAWAAIAYTYSNINLYPGGAISYKGRHFIINQNDLGYEYTDIGQLTGATHGVDLKTIFSSGTGLRWVSTFCPSDNNIQDLYIAFANNVGEVLIYGGDSPGSPTWSIKARVFTGVPVTNFPYAGAITVQYEHDALIMTNFGVVSLRQLWASGIEAATTKTVSQKIDPYWRNLYSQAVAGSVNTFWSGCYFPDRKQIIFTANNFAFLSTNPGTFSLQTGYATILIYNLLTGSWSIYRFGHLGNVSSIVKPIYLNGAVYLLIKGTGASPMTGVYVLEKEIGLDADCGNNNSDVTFNGFINSAWSSLGEPFVNKEVVQTEVLCQGDLFASTPTISMTLVGDFGIRSSGMCTVAGSITPVNFALLKYSVGIDARYVQYSLAMEARNDLSPVAGFTLYDVNMFFTSGTMLT